MNTMTELVSLSVVASVMFCWLFFAGAFLFRKKHPQPVKQKRDNASLVGILFVGVGYAIVWSVHRPMFSPILELNTSIEIIVASLTVALSIGSVWIVLSAVRTLGKQWSISARIVHDHTLVTAGPYGLVRHPIYTGMIGMMIATGLAISTWEALVSAIIFGLLGTTIRIRSEEKLLRSSFGAEFEHYVQMVPALFPRLFRI
jgi:protein-S-isoprenylcysteine O-methyltransferase Ste14